jgi:hypothetical protein
MAGTDGKAQEAEFLEYARTNTATDEFDSLLGLAEGVEATPIEDKQEESSSLENSLPE